MADIQARLKIRRGTDAEIQAALVEAYELIYATDTNKLYMSNGFFNPKTEICMVDDILDQNNKVIYDPANATSTPTPSKIPIADGSGSLDSWVSLSDKEDVANKGQASGYASLDANAKVPIEQIPATVVGSLQYQGAYDCSLETYPSDPESGDYYVASVEGTIDTILYRVGDWLVYNGSTWDKLDNATVVSSVAGKVGPVTLVKGDVGLGNVANVDTTTTANITDSTGKRFVTEDQYDALKGTEDDASATNVYMTEADLDSLTAIEITTDLMELSYIPTGYDPEIVPETTTIAQLSSHLKGISDKLAELESRIEALE